MNARFSTTNCAHCDAPARRPATADRLWFSGDEDPLGPNVDPLPIKSMASFDGKRPHEIRFAAPELHAFPFGKVSLFSGMGGIGKSSLMLQFGIARDLGEPWLDMDIGRGRTLFVSCEDDANDLHLRASRICDMYDVRLGDLENFHVIDLVGRATELVQHDPKTRRLEPTPLCAQIRRAVDAVQCDVLILDGASHMFAGSEIDKVQVRQFLDLLTRIAKETGVAVILLFHPSKAGIESGSGKSGSEAWHNQVRHRIYYEPHKPEDGIADDNLRTMTVMKSNFGPTGQSVTVRNESGVFVREQPGSERARELHDDRLFVGELYDLVEQGRAPGVQPSNNFAPTVIASTPAAKSARRNRRALTAAMNRLLKQRVVIIEETGPPSKRRQRLIPNEDNARTLTLIQQYRALAAETGGASDADK